MTKKKASAKKVSKKKLDEKEALEKDKKATYNEFKEFEGKRYTGMKVGRSHSWKYDPGVWKEKKMTPDEWEVNYNVTKRRSGKAPEGSGVPVGTEYHWYIIGHQNVTKLNANEYSTSLTGVKFKLAHKRAGKGSWSVSAKGQRKRAIRFLRGMLEDLEAQEREEKKVTPIKAKKKRSTKKSKGKQREKRREEEERKAG